MFKKTALLLTVTFLLASFTACGKEPAEYDVSELHPFPADTIYEYTDEGGDANFNWSRYWEIIGETRLQSRLVDFRGPNWGEVYVLDETGLALWYNTEVAYYLFHQDMTDEESNTYNKILPGKIREDSSWYYSAHEDGSLDTAEVTDMNAKVTVPYGEFTAVEVTISFADGTETVQYYAKDVGLVKAVYKYEDGSVRVFVLSDVRRDSVFTSEAMMFYPGPGGVPQFDKYTVEYGTNSDYETVFMEYVRKFYKDKFGYDVDGGLKINSVKFDRTFTFLALDIDFSKEFIGEMEKAGQYADEADVFFSAVNNIISFYRCDGVRITVEGEVFAPVGTNSDKPGYYKEMK